MSTKICSKCKLDLSFDKFSKNKGGRYGLRSRCKECCNQIHTELYRTKYSVKDREKYWLERDIYLVKNKEQYQKHKEKRKQKSIEWYLQNRESRLERMREYREKNKEQINLIQKKYRTKNIHKYIARNAERRALVIKRIPKWANLEVIDEIYKQRDELSKQTGILHHVDHIIPLQGELVSGLHVENNLRIVTWEENVKKSNKFIEDLLNEQIFNQDRS